MIEVRAATANDLVSIATIHIACWQTAYRGILPDSLLDGLNLEERLQRWHRWMAQTNRFTFVATDDETITGFTSFAIENAIAEISHIYVDPSRQHSGAAPSLLSPWRRKRRNRSGNQPSRSSAYSTPAPHSPALSWR